MRTTLTLLLPSGMHNNIITRPADASPIAAGARGMQGRCPPSRFRGPSSIHSMALHVQKNRHHCLGSPGSWGPGHQHAPSRVGPRAMPQLPQQPSGSTCAANAALLRQLQSVASASVQPCVVTCYCL